MQSLPKRCHHIKTNGTQCGSPAMSGETHCYFHFHYGTRVVQAVGQKTLGNLTLPPFEDAHSIQSALYQVTRLLLEGRIEHKTASIVFYALQTASENLKRMSDEKPQPAEVVVDPDTVADAPLDMSPRPNNGSDKPSESQTQKSNRKKSDEPSEEETQRQLDYLLYLGKHLDTPHGSDPEVQAELERLRKLAEEPAEDDSDDGLPPGTIQACERKRST